MTRSLCVPLAALLMLAACGEEPANVTQASLTEACEAGARARAKAGEKLNPALQKQPKTACACLSRLLLKNKAFPPAGRQAAFDRFKAMAAGDADARKEAEARLKPHRAHFQTARKLCLAGAGGGTAGAAAISVARCEPWVRWKAAKLGRGDAQAAQAKAGDICACVVKALNAQDALNDGDRAAVRGYFKVFQNAVKRDPAYGHISQAGRAALSASLKACAATAGFVLE